MPWLRSRTERASGITTWSIEWREGGRGGKVRARSLGAVTEREAEFELAAMQAGKATRRESRTVEAQKAVDDYLRHLKASGRREGTIEHDGDKLQPLVDAWAETPLARWSRSMLEGFLNDCEWAPYRVRNSLGVYRRFVAWCGAVGYACGDFVAGFKPPPGARPATERTALTGERGQVYLRACESSVRRAQTPLRPPAGPRCRRSQVEPAADHTPPGRDCRWAAPHVVAPRWLARTLAVADRGQAHCTRWPRAARGSSARHRRVDPRRSACPGALAGPRHAR